MNSSAAVLTESRFPRSSSIKKTFSFDVSSLRSSITSCALSAERVAMYTLAPFKSSTYLMKAQTSVRRGFRTEIQRGMPHSRDLPSYVAMTSSDEGNPLRLIGDIFRRPVWWRGSELAEDTNAMGHGSDLRS